MGNDTEARTAHAVADDVDRLIEASSRFLGCLAPDVEPGIDVASWINVSRFVEATGDENPLFTDVQYGAGSAHHTMLAPPTFVLAVRMPDTAGALEFVPNRLVGAISSLHVSWDDTIRLADVLSGQVRLEDVSRRVTEGGQLRACVGSSVEYRRNGTTFARGRAEVELACQDESPAFFPPREIHRYGAADVARMVEELDTEAPPRGGEPRYWSDVAVGDGTPTVLKGPLTLAELMVWAFAEGRPVRAGNLHHSRLADRDGRRATNPLTGWPAWDRAEAWLDSAAATSGGLSAPAAPGGLLFALAGQHVTHWMGDDGFLRRLAIRIHRPFLYGDALRLSGRVVDRYRLVDEAGAGHHAVTLRVTGSNQLQEPVLAADAVVLLPDRGKPVRLPVTGGLACAVRQEP